jgi:ribosome-associated protein
MLEVSSRIALWFDLANSPSISFEDKELIASRLGGRIDKSGILHITSQTTRSQLSNRELAMQCFVELMQDMVTLVPMRKKTRVSKGAKARRLEEMKRHSMQKRKRSKRVPIED